ncbi:uncharacterized protein V6R79_004911 [Siganus canaliculatus]
MNWVTWTLFLAVLWNSPGGSCRQIEKYLKNQLKRCSSPQVKCFVVINKFNGIFNQTPQQWKDKIDVIIFLHQNTTGKKEFIKRWPRIMTADSELYLLISNWHIKKKLYLHVLEGPVCDSINRTDCQVTCVETASTCKQAIYDEEWCTEKISSGSWGKNWYFIPIAANKTCVNCNNPVKQPEVVLELKDVISIPPIPEGEKIGSANAAKVMDQMSNVASSINGSSAELMLGDGITGVLVRETDPEDVDEVSFAYESPHQSINIIDNKDSLATFSRSVTVPKEAFEKLNGTNVTVPFAALFRFNNLTSDDPNNTVLNDEVLAIEMGTQITNLTDKISINFQNVKYDGIPSCQSWNGQGDHPNWTEDGCQTIITADSISCQCSHLTFFAILLAPLNETTSSSDLNNLTVITQVGCGLSIFFLCIVLFMHFLLRKTKASKTTRLLIHLVSAMLLLNLTFLINNFVANLRNSMGCCIMAAVMHYFMLATFTWFAAQAFHLCKQLQVAGKIVISRYVLKVSVTCWALPSFIVIVLLIMKKYGEQVIHTDGDTEDIVMCWIIDNNIHMIVNTGYYAVVFLFTFTTFIIMISWLVCLKRANAGNPQFTSNGKSIVTILGLCSMLGITWGFAFFAHGAFRIPSYYIFTVFNSFQGFFLFIYYYNSRHSAAVNNGENGRNTNTSSTSSTSSTSTLKTSMESENPYYNLPYKK